MRRPTLSVLAVAFSTACGPQGTEEIPGPVATRTQHEDLQNLNGELSITRLAEALSRLEHFRQLCDDLGYPRVGNIVSKTGDGAKASEFCAEIRELRK